MGPQKKFGETKNYYYLRSMKTIILTITLTLTISLQLLSQIVTDPFVEKTTKPLIIRGIGNVSPSSLLEVKRIIEDFFGVSPKICESVSLPYYLSMNDNTIDGDKFVTDIVSDVKTIYITDKNIFGQNMSVRGITRINGKTLLIENSSFMKETLIHEIGHSIGLYHCNDLSCIMAINNDEFDSGKFCDRCKNTLIE